MALHIAREVGPCYYHMFVQSSPIFYSLKSTNLFMTIEDGQKAKFESTKESRVIGFTK